MQKQGCYGLLQMMAAYSCILPMQYKGNAGTEAKSLQGVLAQIPSTPYFCIAKCSMGGPILPTVKAMELSMKLGQKPNSFEEAPQCTSFSEQLP